ncbi:MAG: inorganic phosphate transporter [Ruminobacter sp.]|uniref:Phosphate transporter n=1 Tax=Ruminobacter amylophilus TaxID=867 RepID=A0A662ZGF8_9GAMM|nr:inorganic phosphate transporter [Ruminobacter sp.]SFP27840.1 inorganic phosphate transporter, PiT family [Ruminobacter amylophilus]
MDFLLAHSSVIIFFAGAVAFLMAWGIGANDVSNAMGTSVGTKTLTVRNAIIIAIIFEFLGSYFAGGEVVSTIKDRVIDSSANIAAVDMILGMVSSMLAAGIWLVLASYFSWPVSTTHSIIGAIVGFGIVSSGLSAIHWDMFTGIVGSWIITPVIAGILAFVLFLHIQRFIFWRYHPLKHAKRFAPYYVFLTILLISVVTIEKGLKHVNLNLTTEESWGFGLIIALVSAVISAVILRYKKFDKTLDVKEHYANVEKVFSILMLMTACAMAFAHGSNDVANAIGPLASVATILTNNGDMSASAEMPWWILPLGAVGMVVGLGTFGYKVMSTVGSGITALTPSRGFAAQLATASTVVIASGTGLPISTTQTLVGAIMGVGLARGIAAINLTIVRNIIVSWVVTLPAGAFFSILFYYIFKLILFYAG